MYASEMCIAVIVLNYSVRFPLIVAHNREEDISRPTSRLLLKDNILSALDLKAGGVAAVGLNTTTGTIGLLTNCRLKGSLHIDGLSRGSILRRGIQDGPSSSLEKDIGNEKFQGDFHMYLVNAFFHNTVQVNYFSPTISEPVRINREVGDSALEVIVRMNEHPVSLSDWEPKLRWVESLISNTLCEHPNMESAEDVLKIIESCLSLIGNGPLPILNPASDLGWSPTPVLERVALRQVILSPFETGLSSFGTVSQTLVVVDRDASTVHYRYRTLSHSVDTGTQFNSWNKCSLTYS